MAHPDALLLDMGGVLIRERADLRPSPVVARVGTIINTELDGARARTLAMAELGLTESELARALEDLVARYEPDPRVWKLLSRYRPKLKTAILNNGSSLALDAFDRRFGIFGAVDLFLNSALEGIGKPHAEFFERACTRLGVAPSRCVFVDDSETHTRAAGRLGMQTVHWSDPKRDYRRLVQLLP